MIEYKNGYKYQLFKGYKLPVGICPEEPVGNQYVKLSDTGVLVITHGYAWDGPSGPTIDTKSFMRGSLIHDALYQLMREGYISEDWRNHADKTLKKICLEDRMWRIRAQWVYLSVKHFGGPSASPDNKKPVLSAP